MGEIKKFLQQLVATWSEHVAVAKEHAQAARDQVTATVVLAENVAALRESVERQTALCREEIGEAVDRDAAGDSEEKVQ